MNDRSELPEMDSRFMHRALELAARAAESGEVPVGAVVVSGEEIVGEGWNRPIGSCDPTAHAEVVALRDAARRCENYRLPGTHLYVTLEPCSMCAGALVHARVQRLIYGADEPRAGAIRSAMALLDAPSLNHRVEVQRGVLADQSSELLRAFFASRRHVGTRSGAAPA